MKSLSFLALVGSLVVSKVTAQSPVYGQCGGSGWTGAKTCASGSICTYSNAYYSQCLPGSAPPPSSTTKPTTTAKPPTTTTSSTGGGTSTTALKVPDTLGTHDPSRVIKDGNNYYFYSTSDDITGWYTTDGGNSWKGTPAVFPNGIPADVHNASPTNDGRSIWAPDVIWNSNTNLFYLYYAVADWNNGTRNAIGLVTSPTLNPSTAKWTDRGVVIARTPTDNQYSAIDPCPFFDAQGNMWMSLGSGYAQTESTAISIVALNKNTGLRSDNQVHVVQAGHIEASYVHYRDGYYYLFWNSGGCCDGASSTYTIHVARSTSVTGPYSGTQTFDSSTSTEHGPGQIGIITDGGKDYYSYHYYPNTGGSVLGYNVLNWGSDGWPSK